MGVLLFTICICCFVIAIYREHKSEIKAQLDVDSLPIFKIIKVTFGDYRIVYKVQKKVWSDYAWYKPCEEEFPTLEDAQQYVNTESKRIADNVIISEEVVG